MSWPRADIIAFVSLMVAIVGAGAAVIVVPEIHDPIFGPSAETLRSDFLKDQAESNQRFKERVANIEHTSSTAPECIQIERNLTQISNDFTAPAGAGFSKIAPKSNSEITAKEMQALIDELRQRSISADNARNRVLTRLISDGRMEGCFR